MTTASFHQSYPYLRTTVRQTSCPGGQFRASDY
jgi:hypothetical protein